MNEASERPTVREEVRIDGENLLLKVSAVYHDEWAGRKSDHYIIQNSIHEMTNVLLRDLACFEVDVGHGLEGVARADEDADNDVTLHLRSETVQVNFVTVALAL